MAKKKRNRQHPSRTVVVDPAARFDLDEFIARYIWLLVPILVAIYYVYSTGSTGFYQDDEIGHYRNIRGFWGDPFSIMGNQPKPGWKILLVLPGLLGFKGVLLAHCLITALSVVATFHLGRALNIRNAGVGAILLAFQPMYLQLSFRAYSEITAGLFIVLALLFYARDKHILSALLASYVFSIRQEFALVALGMGVLYLLRKQWIPFLVLGWTPVVLALIGWWHTGNPLWLLEDMQRIGLNVQVPHKPFWHYFETYIFIIGPVSLVLFLVGYFQFLYPPARWKEHLKRYGMLYFTFTVMFAWAVVSAWDALNFGANPGHWRYLISISPLAAVFASVGFTAMLDPMRKQFNALLLSVIILGVLVFLTYDANGLVMVETREYTKFGVAFGVGILFLLRYVRALPPLAFAVLLLGGGIGYTFATEKPRTLDPEAALMKQVAEWYLQQGFDDRPLLANHVLLRYFADIDINDKRRDMPLQIAVLDTVQKGAICVWDSHYGNSQFGGDVPMDYFKDNPRFRLLRQFISPDQRFGVLVLEKIE